uniref:Transmembrane protein 65 n=1 Tax=Salmo trutta TaxID=8032 RepID=A0A674DUB6_SALTR
MFKLCLQIALRPTISTRAVLESVTVRKVLKVSNLQSCWMGTLGRNEPREPLNSPKRAKEFIYSLHPKERTCLLKELQSFESIAIAQDSEASSCTSQLRGQSETPEGEVGLQGTTMCVFLTDGLPTFALPALCTFSVSPKNKDWGFPFFFLNFISCSQ